MPNRMLREGLLDSDAVGQVSPGAEMLFVRLMLLADDFGRYDGRVSVICRRAFVNRRTIDEPMTDGWLAELVAARLVVLYGVKARPYLQIDNFRQRTRAQVSKYPSQEEASITNQALTPQFVRQAPDTGLPDARPPRTYSETETETETEEYPLTPLQGAPLPGSDSAKPAAVDPQAPAPGRRRGRQPVGIRAWLKACADAGERAIPEDCAAAQYAQQAGIPAEFFALHWREFKQRSAESEKRYADWRRAFLNSLRGNWYGLWMLHADGACSLTTKGVQARRVHEAMQADARQGGAMGGTA